MSAEDCEKCRHINNCLGDCVGYEEVKPQEQTNEEWFCSLTTKGKAEFLAEFDGDINDTDEYDKSVFFWDSWLKEKHTNG